MTGGKLGSRSLARKIERIVNQITANKDKKWLQQKLKHAHEPSLEERIFEAFRPLPLSLDTDRLRSFAKSCAEARNNLSHFGGPRSDTGYAEFIRALEAKSDALSTLYHALLLNEIGVEGAIVKGWIYDGPGSYPIRRNFVEVGLFAADNSPKAY
jgi:hypothetical protein